MVDTIHLRVKCKSGQQTISKLSAELTVVDLKEKLSDITGISVTRMKLLHGFPPIIINSSDNSAKISTLNIRSGDTVIVEEEFAPAAADPPSYGAVLNGYDAAESVSSPSLYSFQGYLTRKMVPPNNSCLFTAINYVMNNGKQVDLQSAQPMRSLVARIVSENATEFGEAVLERSNSEYCAWILDEKSWGGAIELSILAKHYKTEIDVIDAQSGRIDRFGEAEQYPLRVFLFYDGTHYDPIALDQPADEPSSAVSSIRTRFSTTNDDDISLMAQAVDIATEARASRQYTDLQAGTMRCGDCGVLLRGEREMVEHGRKTAHVRFSEVRPSS